jgi:hypothetical protein
MAMNVIFVMKICSKDIIFKNLTIRFRVEHTIISIIHNVHRLIYFYD